MILAGSKVKKTIRAITAWIINQLVSGFIRAALTADRPWKPNLEN